MSGRKQMSKRRAAVHRYMGGLRARDLARRLGSETRQAYGVLLRDEVASLESRGFFGRFWHRMRVLFLALSYKLSPPRRVLFAVSVVLALFSLTPPAAGADSYPPLAIYSVVGLIVLLALELADRMRFRDELEVARDLQHELLPSSPPELSGYEFAFSYRAADTIGGDYYDFLELADGRMALVIADASGHGMAAGLLMAITNATLKMAIDIDPEPVAVTTALNRVLHRTGGRRAFLTLFYGVMTPESGRLEYSCAGHPYPLLRRTNGEIVELGSASLPLGQRPELPIESRAETIEPGDTLVLYTDGIPEAVNDEGDAFGFDRLRALLAAGGVPLEVHDRILEAVASFEGEAKPLDDRSLVVMERPSREARVAPPRRP